MALMITKTGNKTVLDETNGLQNDLTSDLVGDLEDNDTSMSLPAGFSARLTAVGVTTFLDAALTGHDGSNSGLDAFTITDDGGGVDDLGLTQAGGVPFPTYNESSPPTPTDGIDSGLDAVDGGDIYLFQDITTNNIVYGVDTDGDIVLAIYLDEANDLLSGKLWTVQTEAIVNPTSPNNFDEPVDLMDKLFVTASRDLEFSVENAPAGQSLHITFSSGESPLPADNVAIIVTGETPPNTSDGESISDTDRDTVNTRSGTSFGTNSQGMVPNKSLWFTFVSGTTEDFTVPNLDQNEADVESTIQFTDFFDAMGARFIIEQVVSGKTAAIRLTAVDEEATAANADEDLFVDELLDGGTSVDIDRIVIEGTRVVNGPAPDNDFRIIITDSGIVVDQGSDPGITATFHGDDSVSIFDVAQGDMVEYTTDGTHERVNIANIGDGTGQDSGTIDIGSFELVQGDLIPLEIGSTVEFEDDGPTASIVDGGGMVQIDETADTQDDDTTSAGVIALFTGVTNTASDGAEFPQYATNATALVDVSGSGGGTDGAVSTVISLAIVGGDNVDSGLKTTDSLLPIRLVKEGDLIVGRIDSGSDGTVSAGDPNDDAVFAIAINQDGTASIALYASLDHLINPNPDDQLDLTGLVNAVVTVTDGDGDVATNSFGIGDKLKFDDDGPTASIVDGGGMVQIDETADTQDNDTTLPGIIAIFAGVTNTASDGAAFPQYATNVTPLVDVSGSSTGEDGGSTVISLAIVGGDNVDSGLKTTDGLLPIRLVKEGDLIVGRIDSGNDGTVSAADPNDDAVFAIAITQIGTASMALYASLDHLINPNPDDQLDLTGLVNAVVTVTDGDGDVATNSFGIGDKLKFDDDGPTASIVDGGGMVQIDETTGIQDDDTTSLPVIALFAGVTNTGSDGAAFPQYATNATALVSVAGSSTGEDGGSTVISLAIVGGDNTDSGLKTTDSLLPIRLVMEGGLIVGRIDSGDDGTVSAADPNDDAVFAIAINQDGTAAIALYMSLDHPIDTDPDDQLNLSGLVNAVVTVTDGDGDVATNSFGIGDKLKFDDDGPAVSVDNLMGSFVTTPQMEDWLDSPREDGFESLNINFDSYEIGTNGVVNIDADLGTQTTTDGMGNLVYMGSITDDFNNDGMDDTVNFTLKFNPATDMYTIELTTPPTSIVEISSADGSLDAGGPDPVRTLTVDSTDIVFSSVEPLTNPNLIKADLDQGEAHIEANATYLDDLEMNVSTSGIGTGNNNFNGNANAGVDGLTTNGGKVDESFVVDPDSDVSSMKVFIDNSVSGYDNPPEGLFYRVYFSDGSFGAITEVEESDLTAEAGGQVSFVVGDPMGDSDIDAVQLFMGTGTVKIPVIEFTITESFEPESLDMDFTATIVDGDDDTSTATFSIDLDPVVA